MTNIAEAEILNIEPSQEDLKLANQNIDSFEQWMLGVFPVLDLPLTHSFTDSLYIREIFMPAGTLLTSKIHKTEHPFMLLSGKADVWSENRGLERLEAGHVGITKPNTRRVIFVLEDCRWATIHAITKEESESKNIDEIENRIIEQHHWDNGLSPFEYYSAMLKEANPQLVLPENKEV